MKTTDESIKKAVVDQLYWDDRVDVSDILVEVSDGEVKLTGTVPYALSVEAARIGTYKVPGVRGLDMRLNVEHPSDLQVPTDDEIQAKIHEIFSWDTVLRYQNIDVTVASGHVTLDGFVDAYWQKNLANKLSSSVIGVRGITDKLVAVPTRKSSDELIAQAIMAALERTSEVDIRQINVEVNNGVVGLSGRVPAWRVYFEVDDIVKYTTGVSDVHNHIIVG